jgi:hypothetical protein
MAHAAQRLDFDAALAPAVEPLPPGPLTFYGHRGAYQATRKAAGCHRIVFVGDSMTFGQGVPASQILARRVARHLNGARPGLFVESVTLGLPGACLFSALGRALTHARQFEADTVVISVCANDAYMLRPQPPTHDEIGQTWLEFAPLVETALQSFVRAWRSASPAAVVLLYFDRSRMYGEVAPATVLAGACDRANIPFVDGSIPLADYPAGRLQVSVTDGHLNAFAHDAVARHVARALLQHDAVPAAADFSSPAWLDVMAPVCSALIESGVTAPMAAARMLALLDEKWKDRRNRNRLQWLPRYKSIREAVQAVQRTPLSHLGWVAAARLLCERTDAATMLDHQEFDLSNLNAAAYALEHAIRTGEVGQDLSQIASTVGPRPEGFDSSAFARRLAGWQAGAAAQLETVRALARAIPPGMTGADADELRGYAVRLEQWATAFRHTLERLAALLNRKDPPCGPDTAWLLAYAERTLDALYAVLVRVATTMPWNEIVGALANLTCPSPWMTIEITAATTPGPERWSFRVGGESVAPAWREGYVSADDFIRDGEPHVYAVEIPFTLLATIRLQIFADGLDRGSDPGGPIRVRAPRIVVPGGRGFDLACAGRVSRPSPDRITIVYRPVSILECLSR